jgi:basic membrane lipoprotein Med (substrate-binding protein (PBP1-ABC) superfamily)
VELLTVAVAADPLRERTRELVMVALYRLGRQAEALRSYRRYARLLADELGIDPSPGLRLVHEQVLLHDPVLFGASPAGPSASPTVRNPYKGLRPFAVADAGDFFGREALIDRVLDQFHGGARLVTLIGPSGSGKSSVMAAGVLPRVACAQGAWQQATVPMDDDGARELERWAAGRGPVVVCLDQLEELFLHPDPAITGRFLRALATVLSGHPDVRVLATLRGDFYDRPLQHPEIVEAFLAGVVTVVPLSPAELETAVVRPASRVGAHLEPALVAELVADAVNRPGALPLLQYVLAELFDRCGGGTLTAAAYHDAGRLGGALQRRAENLLRGCTSSEQEAAKLLLLQLVRIVPGLRAARRSSSVEELLSAGADPADLSTVLHRFVAHRLLLIDRDPRTGEGTVELAHESLLWEWDRYASWVDRYRTALTDRDSLAHAAEEWESAGRQPDYLLRGRRLDRFLPGSGDLLLMTVREREFVELSVRWRAEDSARTVRGRRRGRLMAVLAVAVMGTAGAAAARLVSGGSTGPEAVLMFHDAGTEVDQLVRQGFERAVADFDLDPRVRSASAEGAVRELEQLSRLDPDVVLVGTIQTDVDAVAPDHPDVQYVVFDQVSELPNVTSVVSLDEQGAYLAGAAAALTSRTGVVGFVGGVRGELIGRFEAGFTAGARSVRPDVDVLVEYLSRPPDYEGFVDVAGGERAATAMYGRGADVVFAAAGQSGLGVFEAAADLSGGAHGHLWAIGVDSDQHESVYGLLGAVEPERWQRHILTSVIKAQDETVYGLLQDADEGRLESGPREVGLADGAVRLAWSGGHLAEFRPALQDIRSRVIAGDIDVPHVPAR